MWLTFHASTRKYEYKKPKQDTNRTTTSNSNTTTRAQMAHLKIYIHLAPRMTSCLRDECSVSFMFKLSGANLKG